MSSCKFNSSPVGLAWTKDTQSHIHFRIGEDLGSHVLNFVQDA